MKIIFTLFLVFNIITTNKGFICENALEAKSFLLRTFLYDLVEDIQLMNDTNTHTVHCSEILANRSKRIIIKENISIPSKIFNSVLKDSFINIAKKLLRRRINEKKLNYEYCLNSILYILSFYQRMNLINEYSYALAKNKTENQMTEAIIIEDRKINFTEIEGKSRHILNIDRNIYKCMLCQQDNASTSLYTELVFFLKDLMITDNLILYLDNLQLDNICYRIENNIRFDVKELDRKENTKIKKKNICRMKNALKALDIVDEKYKYLIKYYIDHSDICNYERENFNIF